jgi:hypothetical protein
VLPIKQRKGSLSRRIALFDYRIPHPVTREHDMKRYPLPKLW